MTWNPGRTNLYQSPIIFIMKQKGNNFFSVMGSSQWFETQLCPAIILE